MCWKTGRTARGKDDEKCEINFCFEGDDYWTKKVVKEMIERAIDPIYHLGDVFIGELNVEEIEVEK